MSAPLTAEGVERSIREMWDALVDAPRDEDYDAAYQDACDVERQLRERFAGQERLRDAAPDLLAVLCELVNSPNAKQNALWDCARAAIAKATKAEPQHSSR